MSSEQSEYDPDCIACKRLDNYLKDVKERHPDYHCRPVPAFGVDKPKLLIIGLAPGLHGANKTGRPFTGDHAGILLYETLFEAGFSSRAVSRHAGDALKLIDCRITNAVKCLPPDNKPTIDEIRQCNHYLASELRSLPRDAVMLALGKIAHDAVLRAQGLRLSEYTFAHATWHDLPDGRQLIDSYHCSRYNTQTRRLTTSMFRAIFDEIRRTALK